MLDGLIVAVVLAAFVGAGLWTRRRKDGLGDYVLASRSLTLPLFVATLVPSFYGGVLGIGEFTWQNGLSNWLIMALPYYVFAVAYALLLAGRIRLEPGMTIPDHFERAYGRPAALLAAWLVFLLCSPADEFLMIGALLSYFTKLPLAASMAVGGGAAVLILLRGGLRSDVRANVLQFLFMFGGFALLMPFAASKVAAPSRLLELLPPSHRTLTGGLSPLRIAGWWLIAVWTIVDPVFHQRSAAAESPQVARRGILLCVLCWAVFDVMSTGAGLYARAALPSLQRPLLALPALADALMPAGPRGLFFAALLASILAGLQGRALQSSIALGKDGLGRWLNADEGRLETLSQLSLAAASALGYALALAIPSVTGLWYAIGSAVIPGLLLPLLGVYFPRIRPAPAAALAAGLGGWLLSTGWIVAGYLGNGLAARVEPMFPGLGLSALIWGAGLLASRAGTATALNGSAP